MVGPPGAHSWRRAGNEVLNSGSLVKVDQAGDGYTQEEVPLKLRRARSTRISIDGNAHFCRGLLHTRYPDSGSVQVARPDGAEPAGERYDPRSSS
jgi:hypothetical protein